jgi:hypothetical protein
MKNKLNKINKEYNKELKDLSFIEKIFIPKQLIYVNIYNKIMRKK